MSTASPSMPAFEMPPVAVKRSLTAVSFALRFAFVGLSLSFAGVIALFTGGMDPLNAAVLAVCGGGVAYASLQYVRRWSDAESALEHAVDRRSVHQTAFTGSNTLQRQG